MSTNILAQVEEIDLRSIEFSLHPVNAALKEEEVGTLPPELVKWWGLVTKLTKDTEPAIQDLAARHEKLNAKVLELQGGTDLAATKEVMRLMQALKDEYENITRESKLVCGIFSRLVWAQCNLKINTPFRIGAGGQVIVRQLEPQLAMGQALKAMFPGMEVVIISGES